jgi:hypothetical protein
MTYNFEVGQKVVIQRGHYPQGCFVSVVEKVLKTQVRMVDGARYSRKTLKKIGDGQWYANRIRLDMTVDDAIQANLDATAERERQSLIQQVKQASTRSNLNRLSTEQLEKLLSIVTGPISVGRRFRTSEI